MESDFDLISSLFPKKPETEDDEEDSESEDVLRETILLLLRLCYAQAQSQLLSLAQELELLQNAPRMPPPPPSRPEEDRRGKERAAENDMWKLDAPRSGPDGKGPLLDPDGKVLFFLVSFLALCSKCRTYSLYGRLQFYLPGHPTAHAWLRRYSALDTVCRPCPSMNTSRSNKSAGTSLLVAGKQPSCYGL
jgi:hypothetical protein